MEKKPVLKTTIFSLSSQQLKKHIQKRLSTFSYDPFGRLLVEKHLDVKGKNKKKLATSRYFYLGYQEIGTLSQTGTIESLKIPGLHGV